MARLNAINPDEALGKTKELFNTISSKFGGVSNMMRTMGNAPNLLEGFINFYGSLNGGSLGSKTNELIALVVAEANGCNYCIAAHRYVGLNFLKLDMETIDNAREGVSKDVKVDAILKFALLLIEKTGRVNDEDIQALKAVGVTEGEISEIIGQVALNIFTNYFNKVAGTELDNFLKQ